MKKLFSTNYSDNAFNFATLILRVVGGLVLAINYGYYKLTHFSQLAEKLHNPYHLPSPVAAGLLVFAEFFCGILVVLGLMTRLACIPIVIAMGTAFFWQHHSRLFAHESEVSVLLLTIFAAILFVGPGSISADRALGK
ncbi:MAG: DoxX family protein [Chitinophagaceae bacterium]